jgi:hypothetical protein
MSIEWQVIGTGVPRTGLTPLTDDELVVCDAIWSRWTAEGFLLDPNQDEALVLPYRHGIAPEQMPRVLGGMRERKCVEVEESNGMRFLALTSFGGSLWEQERQPVWEAYCTDRTRLIDGVASLQIRAVRAEVAEVFFRTGTDAGLWSPVGEVQRSVEKEALIIPWKPWDLAVLTSPLARISSRTDWRLYESRRTWWRTVPELLRSHRVIQSQTLGPEWPPRLFGHSSR